MLIELTVIYHSQSETFNELVVRCNKMIETEKYDSALVLGDELIKLLEEHDMSDSKQYAIVLGKKAWIYFKKTEYNKAIAYYERELKIKNDIFGTTNTSYVLTLNNMHFAYKLSGRYLEAEKKLIEAINICDQVNSDDLKVNYSLSLHFLGGLYFNTSRYNEAEKCLLKARDIKKNIYGEKHSSFGKTLYELGKLYLTLGNYSKSEEMLVGALNVFENSLSIEDINTVSTQMKLAELYFLQNNRTKAKEMFFKAKNSETISENNNPENISSLCNYAVLEWQMQNYSNAESYFNKALALSEKHLGKQSSTYLSCLNSLGVISWVQKKYKLAKKYLYEAIECRREITGVTNLDYATSLQNFAGLLSEIGAYEEADMYNIRALEIYLSLIKTTFPYLSETEKADFSAKIKERFDMFNCYVLDQYKENPSLISEMFNFRLATKAILLTSSKKVRESIVKSGNNKLLESYDKLVFLKQKLLDLYKYSRAEAIQIGWDVDSLENVANNLEKVISERCLLISAKHNESGTTWKDIQKTLDDRTAVVEIVKFNHFDKGWTGKVYYLALVITKETVNHPELVLIDDKNHLESKYIKWYLKAMRHQLHDKDSYYAFWKKIDERIKRKTKIILSPDGIYNKININTLINPNLRYLIDDKTIHVVSNVKDILTNNPDNLTYEQKTAEIFGYPKYDVNLNGSLNNIDSLVSYNVSRSSQIEMHNLRIEMLNGTKVEIDSITNLLKENNWDFIRYTDEKASVKNFKSISSPKLIHVATHGYFFKDLDTTNSNKIFGLDARKVGYRINFNFRPIKHFNTKIMHFDL